MTEKGILSEHGTLSAIALFDLLKSPETRSVLDTFRAEYLEVTQEYLTYPDQISQTSPDFGPTHLKSISDINTVITTARNNGQEMAFLLRHGPNYLNDPINLFETPIDIIYTVPTESDIAQDDKSNLTFQGYPIFGSGTSFVTKPYADGLGSDRFYNLFTTRRWVEDLEMALMHPNIDSLPQESVVSNSDLLWSLCHSQALPIEIRNASADRYLTLTGHSIEETTSDSF